MTRYLVNLPVAPAKHDSLKGDEEYAPGISVTEANGDYMAHVSIEATDAQSAFDEAKRKLDTLLISMALRGLAFLRVGDGAKESIRPVEPPLLPAGELPRVEVVDGWVNPTVQSQAAHRAALKDKHPAVIILKMSGRAGQRGMPDGLVRAATVRHSDLPPRLRQALSLFHLGITAHETTVSLFLCHASLELLASEKPPTALKTAVPDTTQREKLVEAIEQLLANEGLDVPTRKRILDHVREAHATSPLDAYERYLHDIGLNVSRDDLRACRDFRSDIAHGKLVKPDTKFHGLRVKLRSWLLAALAHEVSQHLGVTADCRPREEAN